MPACRMAGAADCGGMTAEEDIGMDNTGKFTHRVADYIRYRPSYPDAFLRYLFEEIGLSQDACVADIGAGTGILTRELADRVKTVYAVEPNRGMRLACMEACGRCVSFVALDGSAEDTGLPDASVDFITVGQAFHWFDMHRTHQEFTRILKHEGIAVLVWNCRKPDAPIVVDNEAACRRHCPDFTGFSGGIESPTDRFAPFFRDSIQEARSWSNDRILDLEAFIGSNLSNSYAPLPGTPAFDPFVAELESIFRRHETDGRILLPMQTWSYAGRI